MNSAVLKLAFGSLFAALLVSSLISGPDGGVAASFLRTVLTPSTSGPLPAPEQPVSMLVPSPSASSGYGEEEIKAGRDGHFYAEVEIEGRRVKLLVDTGATIVLLSDQAASDLGFRPFPGDYSYTASTANGLTTLAPIVIPEIRLGSLSVRSVQAAVAKPGALSGNGLLGMSFLSKLHGYEVRDGVLILKD